MPALNFKPRFVEFLSLGWKTQTILALRRRPFRAGDELSLYTGQRTKQCRLILRTKCAAVEEILILRSRCPSGVDIFLNGVLLGSREAQVFANSEGFGPNPMPGQDNEYILWAALFDFGKFWRERLPFRGQVIRWNHFDNRIEERRRRPGPEG